MKIINRFSRCLECWAKITHIRALIHKHSWNMWMPCAELGEMRSCKIIEHSMEFNSLRLYLTNIYIASVLCLFAFQWMMIHRWHELKWGKNSGKKLHWMEHAMVFHSNGGIRFLIWCKYDMKENMLYLYVWFATHFLLLLFFSILCCGTRRTYTI